MGALATATPNTTGVTTPQVQNFATAPNLGVTAGSAPGSGRIPSGEWRRRNGLMMPTIPM